MKQEEISRPTLGGKFKIFFDKPISPDLVWNVLPPKISVSTKPWVLGIDGKWLRRKGVVIIYRDVTHQENLFWSYWPSESYTAFQVDLEKLTHLLGDKVPVGVVSDWKGAIVSSVPLFFPNCPHQRCLAHVVREAKKLLPKESSIEATLRLRTIAKQLSYIYNQEEKRVWLSQLIAWEKQFTPLLKERTFGLGTERKWWYTHGNLRRAWRLLTDDWNPFFIYLNQPLIPSSNNSLEGTNSQIKKQLGIHRGMKTPQQVSFLFWYLTFTRTKTKQDLKKLWDYWKRHL